MDNGPVCILTMWLLRTSYIATIIYSSSSSTLYSYIMIRVWPRKKQNNQSTHSHILYKKLKNVSCEYDRFDEWLKLNFASCVHIYRNQYKNSKTVTTEHKRFRWRPHIYYYSSCTTARKTIPYFEVIMFRNAFSWAKPPLVACVFYLVLHMYLIVAQCEQV